MIYRRILNIKIRIPIFLKYRNTQLISISIRGSNGCQNIDIIQVQLFKRDSELQLVSGAELGIINAEQIAILKEIFEQLSFVIFNIFV